MGAPAHPAPAAAAALAPAARLRPAEWAAAGGGALVLAGLARRPRRAPGAGALGAAGVAGLALAGLTATARGPTPPAVAAILTAALTVPAVPLAACGRGAGAPLVSMGAATLALGAWWALRDESTPGARPPEVPVRPAPAA